MSSTGGRLAYALAGVVTGLAGIAVSHAVTMVLNVRATPLVTVAEAVRDITPGALGESLIQLVGQLDKPLLRIGVTLGLLGLAALSGILTRRSLLLGNLLFLAMGVVAAVAVATRPGFLTFDLLPAVAGTATWVALLGFLVGRLQGSTTTDKATDAPELADADRRSFLVQVGAVAAVAAAIGLGGHLVGGTRRGVEASRRLLRLPASGGRVPAGAALDVEGIAPWRSSNASFYRIDTALILPAIEADQWRLRIHGMVDKEIELTYRDLLERQLTEAWVTLCCVSNEVGGDLIGNAWWSGVRIADVLAEVGVSPEADAVLQTSEDGWNCGTPLSVLTDDRNAMLAIAMNGQALPVEHGYPVRMVVPGLYGYVSATKWLVDLEVTRFEDFTAYWTDRGWSAQGPIKTQSRIDVPRSGSDVSAGTRTIGGSAWAQHTGIEQVEFQLDGSEWQPATLGRVPGNDTWVQWSASVDVPSGSHTLAVRATDRSGYTQTPVRTEVIPDGASGWHIIDFTAG